MGILFAPAGFSSTFPQLPGQAQLANYDRYNNRVSDGDCNAFLPGLSHGHERPDPCFASAVAVSSTEV
jgi:hypothetical protein